MLLKKTSYPLFIVFLLLSCNNIQNHKDNNVNKETTIIEIKTDEIEGKQDISSLIDTIILTELKEDNGYFIGEATKIFRLEDNSSIIFDRYNAKRISRFDSIGNRSTSYVAQGRGPNELIQISDCWLSDDKKEVYTYDHILKRVIVFSSDLSKIERTYQSDNGAIYQNMMAINDHQFVGYVGYSDYDPLFKQKAHHLFVLNDQLRIMQADIPYDKSLRGAAILTDRQPFQQLNNKVRFSQVYDNNIYSIDSLGKVSVDYTIQYDKQLFPRDFPESVTKNIGVLKSRNYTPDQGRDLFTGYYGFFGEWRETKDYILFSSFNPDIVGFRTIYNKKEHKIVKQGFLFEDAQTKILIPNFQGIDYEKNSFICMYSGAEIMEAFDKNSTLYNEVAKVPESNFLIEVVLK